MNADYILPAVALGVIVLLIVLCVVAMWPSKWRQGNED